MNTIKNFTIDNSKTKTEIHRQQPARELPQQGKKILSDIPAFARDRYISNFDWRI